MVYAAEGEIEECFVCVQWSAGGVDVVISCAVEISREGYRVFECPYVDCSIRGGRYDAHDA